MECAMCRNEVSQNIEAADMFILTEVPYKQDLIQTR